MIRHAQSANNELYTRTGGSDGRSADPPLTDLGHRQAEMLGRFLAKPRFESDMATSRLSDLFIARHNRLGFGLTHLYCSLMTRSIQTGRYIASATGLPLVGWIEVHERGGIHNVDEDTGEEIGLPGPNRDWFAAEHPDLILPVELGELGWWNRPPETTDEAISRAETVWSQLIERHGGTQDRVAIVTHFGFFQSLLTVWLSLHETEDAPTRNGANAILFGMSNTSVSRFELENDFFVIRYLNRVDFLPDEFVTG